MDSNLFLEAGYFVRTLAEQALRKVTGRKKDILWETEQLGHLEEKAMLGKPEIIVNPPREDKKTELAILNWNIATGADNYNKVVDVITRVERSLGELDIITIQEIGKNYPPERRDCFQDLVRYLNMSGVFGGCMAFLNKDRTPMEYDGKPVILGEAILTNRKINPDRSGVRVLPPKYDWANHPGKGKNIVNASRVGNRVSVYTTILFNGREILVESYHGENYTFASDRGEQVKSILDCETNEDRRIIAGDFNTLFGRLEPTDKIFSQYGFERANKNTSTARGFPFRTSNIFYKTPDMELAHFEVLKDVKCSDHYPMIAVFRKK